MESSRASAVETFSVVTGADDETAARILDEHGWDLERGVSFYLERSQSAGPAGPPAGEPGPARGGDEVDEPSPGHYSALPDAEQGPAGTEDLLWDMEAEDADLQHVLALSLQTAERERAGMGVAPSTSGPASHMIFPVDDQDSDAEPVLEPGEEDDLEDIRSLASHRSNRQPRSDVDPDLPAGVVRPSAYGLQPGFMDRRPAQSRQRADARRRAHQGMPPGLMRRSAHPEDGFDAMPADVQDLTAYGHAIPPSVRLAMARHPFGDNDPIAGPPGGHAGSVNDADVMDDNDYQDANEDDILGSSSDEEDRGVHRMARRAAPVGMDWAPPPLPRRVRDPQFGALPGLMPGLQPAEERPELPADVNFEEARMIEALMFGRPYEGRLPDFSAPREPQPLSPSVLAQRRVREEQDAAYRESLQADMVKQAAARAAQEEAEAARLAAEHAQREAEEAAAAKQAAYEEEIAMKASRIPPELIASDPAAVAVMIRFPDGRRVSRRFSKDNPVSSLFDYVDIEGAPEIKPATYNLVTQFPRRVFASDTEGSLADAGLSQRQEAVFIEPL